MTFLIFFAPAFSCRSDFFINNFLFQVIEKQNLVCFIFLKK